MQSFHAGTLYGLPKPKRTTSLESIGSQIDPINNDDKPYVIATNDNVIKAEFEIARQRLEQDKYDAEQKLTEATLLVEKERKDYVAAQAKWLTERDKMKAAYDSLYDFAQQTHDQQQEKLKITAGIITEKNKAINEQAEIAQRAVAVAENAMSELNKKKSIKPAVSHHLYQPKK